MSLILTRAPEPLVLTFQLRFMTNHWLTVPLIPRSEAHSMTSRSRSAHRGLRCRARLITDHTLLMTAPVLNLPVVPISTPVTRSLGLTSQLLSMTNHQPIVPLALRSKALSTINTHLLIGRLVPCFLFFLKVEARPNNLVNQQSSELLPNLLQFTPTLPIPQTKLTSQP